jgi:hypothetical protein
MMKSFSVSTDSFSSAMTSSVFFVMLPYSGEGKLEVNWWKSCNLVQASKQTVVGVDW